MLGNEVLLFQSSVQNRENFAGEASQQLFSFLFSSFLCSKGSGVVGLNTFFYNTGMFVSCITNLLPDALISVLKATAITNCLICINEQKHTTYNIFSICHTFNMQHNDCFVPYGTEIHPEAVKKNFLQCSGSPAAGRKLMQDIIF